MVFSSLHKSSKDTANKYGLSHGRPQTIFEGGNINILLIFFKLLTMEGEWTFTKRFILSTLRR